MRLLISVLILASTPAIVLAQPVNDDLASAISITSLPFSETRSNASATLEVGENVSSCDGTTDHSMWYTYTPASNERVRLEVTGVIASSAVYTDSDGLLPMDTEVGCTNSTIDLFLDLSAGTTYYIRVASSFVGVTGNATVTFEAAPHPTGDFLASPVAVGTLPYSASYTNVNAEFESGESVSSCDVTQYHSIWFTFTPSASERVRFEVSGLNSITTIWTDSDGQFPMDTQVTCQSGSVDQFVEVVSGTTYYIQVASSFQDVTSTFTLVVEAAPKPTGDDLSSAVVLSALPYTATLTNINASLEPLEDSSVACDGNFFHSIWLKYTATADERLRFEASGSNNVNAIFTDSDGLHPMDTELACSNNAQDIILDVSSGTTYYLMVAAAFLDVTAPINVTVESSPRPEGDDLSSAIAILSLPYSGAKTNINAGTETGEDTSTACDAGYFHSIWFAYTATSTERLRIEASGGTSATTTVWTDADGLHPMDAELGCASNEQDLYVDVTSGTTYFISVAAIFQDITNPFTLLVEPAPHPAGDNLSDAVSVSGLPFSFDGTTINADIESSEASASCSGSQYHSVWFSFVAPNDDQVLITTTTGVGTVTTVWTDADGLHPIDTEVACETQSTPLSVTVTTGHTYYISVAPIIRDLYDDFNIAIESESLPIEVVDFRGAADGGSIRLSWRVVSPADGDRINVQELSDGWKTIATTEVGAAQRDYQLTVARTATGLSRSQYRLQLIDQQGGAVTGPSIEIDLPLPEELAIESLYPNPSVDRATLRLSVPRTGTVEVDVFDIRGRLVQEIVHAELAAGWHERVTDLSSLAAGVYFVRVKSEAGAATKRLVVGR